MRVTRESLVRIARQTAQERAFNDRDILGAYVTGSLVGEADPMLGGAADIDLVFVHSETPAQKREFVRLTPDFHLDITHRGRAGLKSPRELRGDPWLGWELFAPLLVYEREKFFDFVQASLRGGSEFEGPVLMLARCRVLLDHGRQIWFDLAAGGSNPGPLYVAKYLKSLFHAGNAVAELSGPPLYERRFLLDFPSRAAAAERPGMAAGMLGLLGAISGLKAKVMSDWLEGWKAAFLAAVESPDVDERIHPARLNYYEKAIRAILESENPGAALWPMLNTWTLAAAALPEDRNGPWREACETLGLAGDKFAERVEGLDQYLDGVEILLEEIAAANGLETSA